MAMVKIKSGKTVKVGSRSTSGKYTYEVQADGSIKNLTTGRTTSPATQKAPAPAPKAKVAKTAPVPAKRKTKVTPAARIDRGESARPTGSSRRGGAADPTPRATASGPSRRGGAADPTPRAIPTGSSRRGGAADPTPRSMASGPAQRGSARPPLRSMITGKPDAPIGGMPQSEGYAAVRPRGFSNKRYGGPKLEMPAVVVPEKSPTSRPRGFSEKRRSGGIFGLDIIRD